MHIYSILHVKENKILYITSNLNNIPFSASSEQEDTCLQSDIVYDAPDLSTPFSTATVGLCQFECQKDASCHHITFDDSSLCHLKASVGTQYNAPGHVSGPRECQPGCFSETEDYFGNDLNSSTESSKEDCVDTCLADPACEGAFFYTPSGACYMKDAGVLSQAPNAAVGGVFFFRSCIVGT